jgi:hypothetical protein
MRQQLTQELMVTAARVRRIKDQRLSDELMVSYPLS